MSVMNTIGSYLKYVVIASIIINPGFHGLHEITTIFI